ncbi:glycosyl transferase family 2, partial [Candidatus Campbellbacteria bacterium CG22_combo_CG10-13_8_21_14_all_43_18]
MPPNNPKVSVVLPTYNRAHLLERSVKSVLEQSYKDLELI